MSRTIAEVDWAESAEWLYELYRHEEDVERRKRLQALCLVRRGERLGEASEVAGVGYRTLKRWLSWYRQGGLDRVLERVPGRGARGRRCQLEPEQLGELWERSAQGELGSYEQARQWVLERYGVGYSYNGMRTLLARLTIHPKVPRPIAAKADPEVQEEWKRGGLG